MPIDVSATASVAAARIAASRAELLKETKEEKEARKKGITLPPVEPKRKYRTQPRAKESGDWRLSEAMLQLQERTNRTLKARGWR